MKNIKNFEEFLNEELFGLSKSEKERKTQKEKRKQKLIDKHNKEIADMESKENQELIDLFHVDKSKKDNKHKN